MDSLCHLMQEPVGHMLHNAETSENTSEIKIKSEIKRVR